MIKIYASDEVMEAFRAYCKDSGASMSSMGQRILMSELSRRGRLRHEDGKMWVQVPKLVKNQSL
ncbi:MAG: hypothetical protein ACXQTR_01755 [Candidatus Methanospirareceae archaeon]